MDNLYVPSVEISASGSSFSGLKRVTRFWSCCPVFLHGGHVPLHWSNAVQLLSGAHNVNPPWSEIPDKYRWLQDSHYKSGACWKNRWIGPVPLEGLITYLYVISYIIYTSARVAKPGQRRQVQGLISQEFLGSNPIPRTVMVSFAFCYRGIFHPSW